MVGANCASCVLGSVPYSIAGMPCGVPRAAAIELKHLIILIYCKLIHGFKLMDLLE